MYCNIDTDRGVEFHRNIDTIDRSNTIFIDWLIAELSEINMNRKIESWSVKLMNRLIQNSYVVRCN